MRPVGETVALLERGGLEVRDVQALREHYVRTVAGWLENFELNLPELTALVGEEVVRVWRLYLVGRLAGVPRRADGGRPDPLRPAGRRPRPAARACLVISTWWGLALLAIGVAAVAMLVTAYAARRAGRVSVVDVTWGLALAAIVGRRGRPRHRDPLATLAGRRAGDGVGCAAVAAHLHAGQGAR